MISGLEIPRVTQEGDARVRVASLPRRAEPGMRRAQAWSRRPAGGTRPDRPRARRARVADSAC